MGIGEAIAKSFADEGASVVLCSRDLARTEAARQRIGHADQTRAVACDVRKRSDIDLLVQAALDRYGRIDIWVNNAGYGIQDSVAAMSMQACRDLFDTNLFGAIECMQAVAPLMKQQGGGTIINVSSVVGYIALPYQAAYSATKHAMNAIGHAARIELQKDGIHVMTVCPGYIPTGFQATLDGYLRRKRDVIVPAKHRFNVKVYQLLPSVVEWVIGRNLRPAKEVIAEMSARSKK